MFKTVFYTRTRQDNETNRSTSSAKSAFGGPSPLVTTADTRDEQCSSALLFPFNQMRNNYKRI